MSVYDLNCCGVSEFADIRDYDTPEETIMDVCPYDQAFVLFTEVQERNHESRDKGRQLRALIESKKLGVVVTLPTTTNPNTSHRIKPYLWRVNRRALSAFQVRMRKSDPENYPPEERYW